MAKSGQEKLLQLLRFGDLDEVAMDYVTKTLKINTVLRLQVATRSGLLNEVIKQGVFGATDVAMMLTLQEWMEHYRRMHEGRMPEDWTNEVTTDTLEQYIYTRTIKRTKPMCTKAKNELYEEEQDKKCRVGAR